MTTYTTPYYFIIIQAKKDLKMIGRGFFIESE